MDIIGLYIGPLYFPPERMHTWDENNLETGGIGGSEIWAIELASKLERRGYHCMVFADCDRWHYSKDGVEYIPIKDFENVCLYTKFKFFITSRRVYELETNINAERIYLMAHDPFILWCDTYNDLRMDKVYKIAYQSDFQKRLLKEKYNGLIDENFFRTFQAIDPNLYMDIDFSKKKNKMLWSSHKIRGARILIEKILPLIRREIPDFEIDVCGYVNDIEDNYFNNEGVNVLGNISKTELIERQKESKIWIYPNWGRFEDGRINDETFCITAIENAFGKNAIVVADRTCFSSTLSGYSGFVGTELFNGNDILDEDKIDELCVIMANQAIKILKDDEYRLKLSDDAYKICKEYTWDNAVDTFINEFEAPYDKIFENEKSNKKQDIILMTAAFRIDNLPILFKSIKDNLMGRENIGITWLICHDRKNAKGNIVPFIDILKEYNLENPEFGWLYYPIDNDNETNYGGTLYNDALKYIKNEYFSDSNPWVYILDDDNVINPLMSESLEKSTNFADKNNRGVIYYNIMYENGICAPLCHVTFCPETVRSNFIPYYLVTDPSQLVIRYSTIVDMGFYKPYLKYDEDIFSYLREHLETLCFPEEWGESQSLNRYQTTHNGITSKEDMDKWKEILNDKNKAKSCTISICTNGDGSKTFLVDSDKIKEILDKI